MKFSLIILNLVISLALSVSAQLSDEELTKLADNELAKATVTDESKQSVAFFPRPIGCQPCGSLQVRFFWSCINHLGNRVRIAPNWIWFRNCRASPTCATYSCPFNMVKVCVPVAYRTSPQYLPGYQRMTLCVLPRECYCRCEWPLRTSLANADAVELEARELDARDRSDLLVDKA